MMDSEENNDSAPPIGNSLYDKKEWGIDKSLQLLENNLNTDGKLLLSIFEIKKKKNKEGNFDVYIHEFLAISNKVYNLGDNRIEF